MAIQNHLTLVILAAGLGSRFGSDKQLAKLGPAGETMLELSILSAIRAGFSMAVIVTRPELEVELARLLSARLPASFEYRFCYQSVDDLPADLAPALQASLPAAPRQRPWGTAHALWSARHIVQGPMGVITADDFYGDSAFTLLAHGLLARPSEWMMVAYPVAKTLSEHGGVNRGICQVVGNQLRSVAEWTQIHYASEAQIDGDDAHDLHHQERLVGQSPMGWQTVPDDALVSMTCWGFSHSVFEHIETALISFIQQHGTDGRAECYLPSVVQDALVKGRELTVQVAQENWLGVTYAQDAPRVRQQLMELMGD